jgi:hypothetical protein
MPFEWGVLVGPALRLAGWITNRFKKPDPVQILQRREKWKREFEEHLPKPNKFGVRCDAIIRDIDRMDLYPNIDEKGKGISPWFKVEIKGLYERGVEAFISMPQCVKRLPTGEWTFCDYEDPEKVTAYPVGRIPFDLIEHVDWSGDQYYYDPHIYCRFKRGQPYEKIVFYRKWSKEDEFMDEIEGFSPWGKKKRFWQR